MLQEAAQEDLRRKCDCFAILGAEGDAVGAATSGVPNYSTWTTPNGYTAKYFDIGATTGFAGGSGTSSIGLCWVLQTGGTADEKFWMKDLVGNWISVADDIIGYAAKMVLWMRTGPTVTVRVSDYNSTVGSFTMNTQSWRGTANLTNDESRCDSLASGLPYAKVAQDGTVTFFRRQGSP